MCLLHVQCQSEEDLLDLYSMVSETSKQKQVSEVKLSTLKACSLILRNYNKQDNLSLFSPS